MTIPSQTPHTQIYHRTDKIAPNTLQAAEFYSLFPIPYPTIPLSSEFFRMN